MLFLIAAYIVTGLLAGTLSGLLGLGGGVIIVPALVALFKWQGLSPSHLMHLATGTSLSVIMLTSGMATWLQNKRKVVAWKHLRFLIPGMMLGVTIGVFLGQRLSTQILCYAFAAFCLILSAKMLIGNHKMVDTMPKSPPALALLTTSLSAGVLAGLLGIGGGAILIPLLMWFGFPMAVVSGTAVACAFPTAITGTLSAVIAGSHVSDLPPFCTGFIYWPAAIILGVGGMLAAPFGVHLAHRLPEKMIKKIFGVILIGIAWKMAS